MQGDGVGYMPDGAVAIRSQRIVAVGPASELQALQAAHTIDATDCAVLPGLIDAHNHLHNGFVSKWARQNPKEVLKLMREFEVTGKTYDDLTKGIELIVLDFPKFTDGRAYTQARLLRERAGYTGELRAAGAVFIDQPAQFQVTCVVHCTAPVCAS